MTPKPLLARIVVAASAVAAPLWAQTPLFSDGGAFGGSKVFSEGLNPLGNPARTSQAKDGWSFTYLDGRQRAKDNKSILAAASSPDPATAAAGLAQLAGAPWALATRAYGIQAIQNSASLAYTRELTNGILAHPDLAGASSSLDGRRTTVDRLSIGGGGPVQGSLNLGGAMRIARWTMGQQDAAYAPPPGAGFGDPEGTLMTFTGTSVRTLTYAMDLGLVAELAPGVRVAATLDQVNPKVLWDVHLKPQLRAGLQFDLGQLAKRSLEGDLNATEQMPFPVKQKTAGASLRLVVGPATVFLVGAEQRKIGDSSTTRAGATLQIRMTSLQLSVGFQAGQDRPMMGGTLVFN